MLILTKAGTAVAGPKILLLFGCGLIGKFIRRSLIANQFELLEELGSHWHDRRLRTGQYQELNNRLYEFISDEVTEIHMVWSAGSGSFASTEKQLEHEAEAFEDTLAFFRNLSMPNLKIFHFISSAGGLFEGNILVDAHTTPAPVRPYGKMKLAQEKLLSELNVTAAGGIRIYRPSTVFGAHDFKNRSGLVSHLMWNVLRNAPTTLESNVDALRDFVFVQDIGQFIVSKVLEEHRCEQGIYHLVSGKPSSIYEIVNRVRHLAGRSPLVQYSTVMGNDANITFSSSLMPKDWQPTGLQQGLREVLRMTAAVYLQDTVAPSIF